MSSPELLLPDWLVAHAKSFYADGGTPALPRRASTVVLLRDGAGGPEAYLLRRAATMAFASGMYAFPGGSVDPRDEGVDLPTSTVDWPAVLGIPDGPARAAVCAAVRETFEESGVLLAGFSAEAGLVDDVSGPRWEAERAALAAHRRSVADLVDEHDLVLRAELLRPWARWITPEFEPRRYDTFFFVAALPAGQDARDLSGEADRTLWLRPAEALAAQGAGELAMLPPTVEMLRALCGYDTVAQVLAQPVGPLVAVTPRVVIEGDVGRMVLPSGPR